MAAEAARGLAAQPARITQPRCVYILYCICSFLLSSQANENTSQVARPIVFGGHVVCDKFNVKRAKHVYIIDAATTF